MSGAALPRRGQLPVAARVRLRFAKRGRLRFTSHRDIQRAFERALRRAGLPVAHSAGFSPHPKVSWAGAVPTGAASESEYVEIGLTRPVEPETVRAALDAALPAGLDVVAATAETSVPLAEALVASHWRLSLPGVAREAAQSAVAALLAETVVTVSRVTKSGRREVDVRASLERLGVEAVPDGGCRLDLVVRSSVPVVRPTDVVAALVRLGMPDPGPPPVATRLAFGSWDGRAVHALF